ncbi:hypothetical protein Ctob_007000, partial [Chrysochromulina tobinii]
AVLVGGACRLCGRLRGRLCGSTCRLRALNVRASARCLTSMDALDRSSRCGGARHLNLSPRLQICLHAYPRQHGRVDEVRHDRVEWHADVLEEANLGHGHVGVLDPVAQRRDGDAELALAVAERPELVRDPLRPFLVHLKRLEAMAEVSKFDRHSQQQRHRHMRLRLEGRDGVLRQRLQRPRRAEQPVC